VSAISLKEAGNLLSFLIIRLYREIDSRFDINLIFSKADFYPVGIG